MTRATAGRSIWWSSIAATAVVFSLGLHAQDTVPAPNNTPKQEVTLRYQESAQPVATAYLQAQLRRDPATNNKIGYRGTLNFGSGLGSTAFAWNQAERELRLDLNGNGNPTDDAAGIYKARRDQPTYYQEFTNVSLTFSNAGGPRPFLANLKVYSYGQSQGQFTIETRSWWAGTLTLKGRDWQFGVVEQAGVQTKPALAGGPAGFLVARDWADRGAAFQVGDGTQTAFDLSQKLFLDGQAYALESQWVSADGKPAVRLSMAAIQPKLGKIEVTGSNVRRLVLTSWPDANSSKVVLDNPAMEAEVPLGTYRQPDVYLQAGDKGAYREGSGLRYNQNTPTFTVKPDESVRVDVGGPLTNTVAVSRRGPNLSLTYQLTGCGAGEYTLVGARQQPEFKITREGKTLHTGKFEFG